MRGLCWLLVLLLPLCVAAREKLPAVALSGVLGSKVVLEVAGQRHILADGESSPEGVQLLTHNHEQATVKIARHTITLHLGAAPIRSSYVDREPGKTVKVYKDRHGMYRTVGSINGRVAEFLVDTGATTIAMSTRKASSLGIDFVKLSKGQRHPVSTANGLTYAYPVMLDSVSVGGIDAKFVRAMIIEGEATREILLGMSYLERLNVSQQQGTMLLQAK